MREIGIIRSAVRRSAPLIHCITNPISINQCANAILAVGARPMMAEHPGEAAEITASAKALLLNLGNITDVRMKSMMLSADIAQKLHIPVIIDAVGISCSSLRRDFILRLIEKARPAVIKGNYSEVCALYDSTCRSSGVDADTDLDTKTVCRSAAALAGQYQTVVLASGKTDVITDGKITASVQNGTPQLASVTGTGCMLGALCACYLSAGSAFHSAVTACAVLGISGALAETDKGSGSFMVNLMDCLTVVSDEQLEKSLSMEETILEKI